MNRLAHGFNSSQPVIPGERLEEFEAYRLSYRSSLVPSNPVEEKICDFLAQQSWKMDRLNRIENGLYRERLEEAVEQSEIFKTFTKTEMAVIVVTALLQNLEGVVHLQADNSATAHFLAALRGTLAILGDASHLPVAIVDPLSRVASQIAEDGEATQEMVKVLTAACQNAVGVLHAELEKKKVEVEKTRELLAEQVLPLEDADVKLIDRYRRCLEASMQRQMLLLNSIRYGCTGSINVDPQHHPFPVQ